VQRAVFLKEAEEAIKTNNEKMNLLPEDAAALQAKNEKLKGLIYTIIQENCRLIKEQAEMFEKHFMASYYGKSEH
jgi:hypothetical protein